MGVHGGDAIVGPLDGDDLDREGGVRDHGTSHPSASCGDPPLRAAFDGSGTGGRLSALWGGVRQPVPAEGDGADVVSLAAPPSGEARGDGGRAAAFVPSGAMSVRHAASVGKEIDRAS